MGLLDNLKLRMRLVVALAPLAAMVIVAGVFTSVESKQIDTWYSRLIDSDIKAVQDLGAARALTIRYGLYLYRLIVEPNSDRRKAINVELESAHDEYKACTADAARLYPALGKQIAATTATFEKAVLDSLPVRQAALANENQKAAELMRSGVDDELERARTEASEVSDQMQSAADQRSESLTQKTHRAIYLTWLFIGFGILATFSLATYQLQVGLIRELLSMRDNIRAIAEGDFDRLIPYLDRPNEMGEIGRSLLTLQGVAREREAQAWVKAEVAATNMRLQEAEDFTTFSSAFFSRFSQRIPLLYGALYLADDSHTRFSRVGTFALEGPLESASYALGEGLVGQAAQERRILDISANPGEVLRVSTVIGTVEPSKLLYIPILNHELLLGVVELAPLSPLTERQRALLNGLIPVAAMNAHLLSRNLETRRLLEQTRAQANSLAASERVILARKEELEASNLALEASQAELRQAKGSG